KALLDVAIVARRGGAGGWADNANPSRRQIERRARRNRRARRRARPLRLSSLGVRLCGLSGLCVPRRRHDRSVTVKTPDFGRSVTAARYARARLVLLWDSRAGGAAARSSPW